MYFLLKSLHLLFVMGWLSCCFVLPRLILLIRKDSQHIGIIALARRIYRFGWYMVAALMVCGAILGSQLPSIEAWLQVKLVLVFVLLLYYLIIGSFLARVIRGRQIISEIAMRLYNESSLLLVLPVLYLALSKYNFGP